MALVDASVLTDEALLSYDTMMIECSLKIAEVSGLAVGIWSDVLKELGRRGKVKLISGSFDNPGNALIHRALASP